MAELWTARMDPDAEGDLRLSHSFINTLSAAYHGMWVFENLLARLEPEVDREDAIAKTERVLETIAGWWQSFERGEPLLRAGERPVLQGDASKAWRLLQVAEARSRALIGELTESSDFEALRSDRWARSLRVAAMLEMAHVQQQTLDGLVRLADTLGASAEADAWRQRALVYEQRIAEGEQLAEQLGEAGDNPDPAHIAALLDTTLLLPANVAQRVVDICQVFGLYTGVFDYTDAGIPDAQTGLWADAGFEPRVAGRWFAAGLTPHKAVDWIAVGASDPILAASFMWRGFSPQEAAPWLHRFIEGRRAAAWQAVGCDAENAREWIALGIRDPMQIQTVRVPDRLM